MYDNVGSAPANAETDQDGILGNDEWIESPHEDCGCSKCHANRYDTMAMTREPDDPRDLSRCTRLTKGRRRRTFNSEEPAGFERITRQGYRVRSLGASRRHDRRRGIKTVTD